MNSRPLRSNGQSANVPFSMSTQHRNHDAPTAPSEPVVDFQDIAATVLRQKWLILTVAVMAAVATAFWTVRQPKVYEASGTLEYNPTPPRPLGAEVRDVANPIGQFWANQEDFRTQLQVIQSRSILERVADRLGLQHNPDFLGTPEDELDTFESATLTQTALVIQNQLSVEQLGDDRLLEISFLDTDAERAQLIVNTVAEVYIEKTREDRLSVITDALAWLNERLQERRSALGESEVALQEYKTEHNIPSADLESRIDNINGFIQQYSAALADTRTRRISLASRLAQLRRADNEDPFAVSSSVLDSNVEIAALRARHTELTSELQTLSTRYGPNHPSIRALEADRALLATQMRGAVDRQIRTVANDVAELRRTEAGLLAQLDEQNEATEAVTALGNRFHDLRRTMENNRELYQVLIERATQTDLAKMIQVTHFEVVDSALAPERPVRPRLSINLLLGLLGGVVLGAFLGLLRERLDRTVRSPAELEALGVTILGSFPTNQAEAAQSKRAARFGGGEVKKPELLSHRRPQSLAAEHCRSIRTNIAFMAPDSPLKTLVITSPGPQEGKTTVACNLATAMAQIGEKVLLIDTDLRRPRCHRVFDISSKKGTAGVLIGEVPFLDAAHETEVPNLFVMPCGPVPPNPAELFHSKRFAKLLADASEHFDRVILDSPPIGAVTDPAIIAPQVDAALLVVRHKATNKDGARGAVRQLREVGAFIAGTVINGLSPNQKSYGYGGYYYRDSYTRDESQLAPE